jgi:hypothetical protein
LERRGISFIVLKSLPQLEDLYGDIGVRSTTDIDLLVPGARAAETFDLILDQGWRVVEEHLLGLLTLHAARDSVIPSRPWHFKTSRADQPSGIDLHSDSMPEWRRPVLDREIWDRAVPKVVDGVRFLVPSWEDRLLFLCWHFLDEALFNPCVPWQKLADIEHALAQSEGIDLAYLAQRARSCGVSIAFRLTCSLAAARSSKVLPEWWQTIPVASRARLRLLEWILGPEMDRLSRRSRSLIFPLMYDRPLAGLRPWLSYVVPSRITVGDMYTGAWPSWPEYLLQLARIYVHRLRVLLRRTI